jgi:hypothetical protein
MEEGQHQRCGHYSRLHTERSHSRPSPAWNYRDCIKSCEHGRLLLSKFAADKDTANMTGGL